MILNGGILEVFRGLKSESDTEIGQKGIFIKGLLFGHEMADSLLQPINGKLKHGENITDNINGLGITPHPRGYRIQPDGVGKDFGKKFQAFDAGSATAFFEMY